MKLKHILPMLGLGLCAAGPAAAQLAEPAPALQPPDAAWREARLACATVPTEDQLDCLRVTYAAHIQARTTFQPGAVPALPGGLPAVQTQSPAVTATGVAPPAVDHRAPGTPAFPKR